MFCPKCGIKNPDDGKYCRKCGTDLGNINDVLSGKLAGNVALDKHEGSKPGWESAIGNFSMGVAFMTVAFILGVTGRGSGWWFWMLIPAIGMIGAGVSKIISIKHSEKERASSLRALEAREVQSVKQEALPEPQTDFVSPTGANYKTGDLVPPSVVENTTRHLKTDTEGETMTLPDDKSID